MIVRVNVVLNRTVVVDSVVTVNSNSPIHSLQCRRILGGRKLPVYVRTVEIAVFVMTEED